MAHSETAMSESFFMSNISPQSPSFNRGIWSSLEANVRDWAIVCDTLYVVTGPILQNKQYPSIGPNNVTIPEYYYKALLDIAKPDYKAIAFILPNTKGEKDLLDYAVTIDSLETLSGINFFHELPNTLETNLEQQKDINKW
jgi:endonuclease G